MKNSLEATRMSVLDKLRAEEAEMERRMKGEEGNPSEEEIEATPTGEVENNDDDTFVEGDETFTEDGDDDGEGSAEATTQEPKAKPEAKPNQQQRVSWKKRYATYKASTDSTIYGLRQELASVKSELADKYDEIDELSKEISELKKNVSAGKDPFEGVISPEDREIIGDEAVDVIKKIIDSKPEDPRVTEMQKEIERYRKEKTESLRREQEKLKRESQSQFKDKLLAKVKNFETVDSDPEFHSYLQEIDEDSGVPRGKLFAAAVASRDVKGTARFYLDFESLKPKTREEILSSKVSPKGSNHSVVDDSGSKNKKTYKISEYEKFMTDLTKGKYRGREKEAKQIEASFDRALQEGRVVEG